MTTHFTDAEILEAWSKSGPPIIDETTMMARFRAFLAALPERPQAEAQPWTPENAKAFEEFQGELRETWDKDKAWTPAVGEHDVPEENRLFRQVLCEVERACVKFPTWPTDPLHALAVMGEEFGELTKEMLQLTYEPHKTSLERVREEAVQTAAMSLRLLRSLDRYEYLACPQHSQTTAKDDGDSNGNHESEFEAFERGEGVEA